MTVLAIGDSFGSSGGTPDWPDVLAQTNPGITIINNALSGRCLYDVTGPNGTSTVLNTIDLSLVNGVNADCVVWASSGVNDLVRRRSIPTATTLANMTASSTIVLDKILAAGKSCIVMGVPWMQAFQSTPSPANDADAIATDTMRKAYNDDLQALCAKRAGFVYWNPEAWMSTNLGVLNASAYNGYKQEFYNDGLHPNQNCCNLWGNDIMAILINLHKRKAAA
jgi:lysophospholipase L1-like esterase